MTIDLEAVKGYCRIDGSEDDELVLSLIAAAQDYLDGAGVPEPEEEVPLYLLAVKALVLHYYDNRGLTQQGSVNQIPGIENAVVQLKLRAEAQRIAETAEG